MLIGVNWTSVSNFEAIKYFTENRYADFCEIMIDNFLHFDPKEIRRNLNCQKFSFHIMNSRYMEKTEAELQIYASKIKRFADELQPIYISDHVGCYTVNGRYFPEMLEVDYENIIDFAAHRVTYWQDLLETKLFLENYPSLHQNPKSAPNFYDELFNMTGSNLLFDFSNAVVAEKNGITQKENWAPLIRKTNRFHISGYRSTSYKETGEFYMDTHDQQISDESISFLANTMMGFSHNKVASIVVERDHDIDIEAWKNDILSIKSITRNI